MYPVTMAMEVWQNRCWRRWSRKLKRMKKLRKQTVKSIFILKIVIYKTI